MNNGILSVKLCEMDSEIAKLHSRIRMSDQLSDERLSEEITRLKIELEDQMEMIHKSLHESRAEISQSLLEEFETLQDGMQHALVRMNQEFAKTENSAFRIEDTSLAAEYTIDFAIVIAKHALLRAYEAAKAEKENEKEEQIL